VGQEVIATPFDGPRVRGVASNDSRQTVARGLGWLRIAVGLTLTFAPRSVLKMQTTDDPSGPLVLMTRTVGIRDPSSVPDRFRRLDPTAATT
jgi:hypothetical protein